MLDSSGDNTLIIDLDDTCIDTLTAFVKWLAAHDRLKNVNGNKITNREAFGDWLNVPDDLANLWYKEFVDSSWQWGATYPMLGAEKVLPILADVGWEIIGYTKSSSDMHRATLRRSNLELLFPNVFSAVYAIGKTTNLYSIFSEYEQGAVCVTATQSSAMASAQAGHVTYMLNQPWNYSFNDMSVRKFANWNEIQTVLLQVK